MKFLDLLEIFRDKAWLIWGERQTSIHYLIQVIVFQDRCHFIYENVLHRVLDSLKISLLAGT